MIFLSRNRANAWTLQQDGWVFKGTDPDTNTPTPDVRLNNGFNEVFLYLYLYFN